MVTKASRWRHERSEFFTAKIYNKLLFFEDKYISRFYECNFSILKKSLYRNGIIKKLDSYKINVKFKENSKEIQINFIHELEKSLLRNN